jgi:hypothetical protein
VLASLGVWQPCVVICVFVLLSQALSDAPGGGVDGRHDIVDFSPKDLAHIVKGVFEHMIRCVRGKKKPSGAIPKPKKPSRPARQSDVIREREVAKWELRVEQWVLDVADRNELNTYINSIVITKPLGLLMDARYRSQRGPPGMLKPNLKPFTTPSCFKIHDQHKW